MPITIERPAPIDVTKANPRSTLYITTDDTAPGVPDNAPNGSFRLMFTPGEGMPHLEEKQSGVWNDAGLRLSSSSLSLGFDLLVSAVGGYLETTNVSQITDHLKALIPHIKFDIDGTMEAAHMPITNKRETFDIFPGPATGEIISTTIGQIFLPVPTKVLHSATHQVGSVGASAEVRVRYFKGTDNTGTLLNQINLPASALMANMPLTIVYDSDFGFDDMSSVFFEFTSTANFSLETNLSGDMITSQDGHEQAELDIMLDEFVFSNDLSFVLDNNLNFVVHNRFN